METGETLHTLYMYLIVVNSNYILKSTMTISNFMVYVFYKEGATVIAVMHAQLGG